MTSIRSKASPPILLELPDQGFCLIRNNRLQSGPRLTSNRPDAEHVHLGRSLQYAKVISPQKREKQAIKLVVQGQAGRLVSPRPVAKIGQLVAEYAVVGPSEAIAGGHGPSQATNDQEKAKTDASESTSSHQ